MPSRRPSPLFDVERFMKRVEDRIDRAFEPVIDKLGDLQAEIRKGNMDTELLTRRVTDLEMQVIESRDHLQISEREGVRTAEAVAASAETAAHAAPRKVWRTRLGLVTAGSAAFVATVAFFNNLPQFVRGSAEVLAGVYHYIVRHK